MERVKVVISGSFRKHFRSVMQAREAFLRAGAEVLRPATDEIIETDGWVRLVGDPQSRSMVQAQQLNSIRACHVLYVVNPGGYVGGSAMSECGFAYGLGIPICFSEPPHEEAAEIYVTFIGSPAAALAQVNDTELLPSDRHALRRFLDAEEGPFTGEQLTLRAQGDILWLLQGDEPVIRRNLQSGDIILDRGGRPGFRALLIKELDDKRLKYT